MAVVMLAWHLSKVEGQRDRMEGKLDAILKKSNECG